MFKPNYERMFNAAVLELAKISSYIGVNPDNGGAAPIIDAIDQLCAHNAELERHLSEQRESWKDLRNNLECTQKELAAMEMRAKQAEQRIAESREQEPVLWIESDPSSAHESPVGALFSTVYSTAIRKEKPSSTKNIVWELYSAPIVPPTVEEVVEAALEELDDFFADAKQTDFENGVKCLNEAAVAYFKRDYPNIWEGMAKINDMLDAIRARSGK